ncbi:MAG: CPBP family intramembrane metalloprotease [Planctomycetota bacterium]|nr:CPBP family intramembrane metalloprotease [Ardenticatenaceae bacterium]GIK54332.1 MAG: CPBP family intramembrane metalloprotease [Planctomycetota bacterium]
MSDKTITPQNTKNLVIYFTLAYVFSWAIGIPLALAKQGIIQPIFPQWFHYFVAYGPMISALIVTWTTQGQQGIKELWGRITKWQVESIWWLVALSPLIIGIFVALAMNLLTDTNISLSDLGEIHFLPSIGIGALFLWLATFGIGEEIGWRGYALPRLQKGHNALYATVILAFFWALWHLPQFFYLFDTSIAIGWAIGLFAGAIVFTWLFNSAEGSILIVAIFHGCFNFISASNAGNGLLAAVISTIVMIWAIVVVFVYKPKSLSSKGKFVV